MLKVHSRESRAPLRRLNDQTWTDPSGNPMLQVTYKVEAFDCSSFFADPYSSGQKIHFRIALPSTAQQGQAALTESSAKGKPVSAKVAAQALEFWLGQPILHVLLVGETLAVEDLTVTFAISLR
jgi:hypothetical protein